MASGTLTLHLSSRQKRGEQPLLERLLPPHAAPEAVPLLLHHGAGFWGLEKLHPFDSKKVGAVSAQNSARLCHTCGGRPRLRWAFNLYCVPEHALRELWEQTLHKQDTRALWKCGTRALPAKEKRLAGKITDPTKPLFCADTAPT